VHTLIAVPLHPVVKILLERFDAAIDLEVRARLTQGKYRLIVAVKTGEERYEKVLEITGSSG